MVSDDLLAREVVSDPYPYFACLRSEDPVHWNEQWGGWILTKYDDIFSMLQSAPLSSDRYTPFKKLKGSSADSEAVYKVLALWLGSQDPPLHSRLRNAVQKAFTPMTIEALVPEIQATADQLLLGMRGRDRMELLQDFTYPLAATVIARMLGMPLRDLNLIKLWADRVAPIMFMMLGEKGRYGRARQALDEMTEYFKALVHERQAHPTSDLTSALVGVMEKGELAEEEVIATCMVVVFGGHETTMNLMANGLLALLRNPAESERLLRNPEIIDTAVEEFLRFDGPAKSTVRWAKEDFKLDGKTIQEGQRVLVVWAAANRDPARFSEPDRLDLGRHPNPHFAFGQGIHYCLGAPLARREAKVGLTTLVRRLQEIRLAVPETDLEWHPTIIIRGLKSLPIRFTAIQ
ncbi:MAG: cytochrome P450 [Nitrospirae bacterium]|nr:cytochrome P450 [Nitrospirota bacterium]